ncbi:MAG TPA: hypothetical protein VGR89_13105 [Puia sp.]|nr:hypothetical protein [Puia sp.]
MDTVQQEELLVNDLDNFFNLQFDGHACDQLRQCALWAKIGAIVNFILCAILVFLWLFTNSGISADNAAARAVLNVVGIGGGVTASLFLYRFSIRVRQGLRNLDALPINLGFSSLRQYFKTNAIIVVTGTGLLLLVILIALISAGLAGRS